MTGYKENQTPLLRIVENSHGDARAIRNQDITRVISFTSGKGGVGKTNCLVNTAIALAREGKSVLVLDADLGLANVDVLLGISPQYTINDVLNGTKTLQEIMLDGPEGISVIPAASGIESICNLSTSQRMFLLDAIEEVAYKYDYLLIDTQAGIGADVMFFNNASSEIVCVINEEPTSLTDAYALIKVLSRDYGEKNISVLANNVPNEESGLRAFKRLQSAVERFLHINLKYIGFVPRDKAVLSALSDQRAVLELYPSSPAGIAFSRVARQLDSDFINLRVKGGIQFFFRSLLEMEAHG
ncbi:MAG: MinD/ParA family protein [Bdellovibrionales bacterium]|nr:MinD/ParA family protein [Bdellovibrionales bacterium]